MPISGCRNSNGFPRPRSMNSTRTLLTTMEGAGSAVIGCIQRSSCAVWPPFQSCNRAISQLSVRRDPAHDHRRERGDAQAEGEGCADARTANLGREYLGGIAKPGAEAAGDEEVCR